MEQVENKAGGMAAILFPGAVSTSNVGLYSVGRLARSRSERFNSMRDSVPPNSMRDSVPPEVLANEVSMVDCGGEGGG